MREKLSINEFESIKNQLYELDKAYGNLDFTKPGWMNIGNEIDNSEKDIINKLISYDLSDIPFEAWSNLKMSFTAITSLNFEDTHANIDFSIFPYNPNINYKSCNLRNLDYANKILYNSHFDESVIESNRELFFPNGVSEDIIRTYNNIEYITMEDIVVLPSETIKELTNLKYNIITTPFEKNISDIVSLDRLVSIYKNSKEDYSLIENIFDTFHFSYDRDNDNFRKYIELLNNTDLSNFRSELYSLTKQLFSNSEKEIDLSKLPQKFVDDNKDFFLLGDDIPEDIRKLYLGRSFITINDIIKNYKIFDNISVDDFLQTPVVTKSIYNRAKKIGLEKLDSYSNEKNLLEFIVTNDTDDLIDYLGFDNMMVFENFEDFFKHGTGSSYNMVKILCDVLKTKKIEVNSNENVGYDDFWERLADLLEIARKKDMFSKDFNYDFLSGEFRNNFPNLFIDKSAPQELKDAYYDNMISIKYILDNNYSKYLSQKNLSDIKFDINPKIKMVSGALVFSGSLINVFSNKYGNDKLFDLLNKYYNILKSIDAEFLLNDLGVLCLNNELDNIETFEMAFRKAIMSEITSRALRNPKKGALEIDYRNLENFEEFKNEHQGMFIHLESISTLSENEKEDIINRFYLGKLDLSDIRLHPELIDVLKDSDLKYIFSKYNPTRNGKEFGAPGTINFDLILKSISPLEYLKLCEKYGNLLIACPQDIYASNDLDKKIEEYLENLMFGLSSNYFGSEYEIRFDDSTAPDFIKANHPEVFISKDAPEELRNKFYNRELKLSDFLKNPDYINYFENTNIIYGMDIKKLKWVDKVITTNDKASNMRKLKLVTEYEKLLDVQIQDEYSSYCIDHKDDLNYEKLDVITKVLNKIVYSNSLEISRCKRTIAHQVINSENPEEILEKIENVFLKNNIPTVGKIFSVFRILYPDFEGFNFSENSIVSPTLKNLNSYERNIVVFNDLIKASFGSNNKSVINYIDNIEKGTNIYNSIIQNRISINDLSQEDYDELVLFSKHLSTLYNNSKKAIIENKSFEISDRLIEDITYLVREISPNGTLEYNIPDRIIKMFCGFSGIDTLDKAKEYIHTKINNAENRNIEASKHKMVFNKGDIIKGIGYADYLGYLLKNGFVSKEYLGDSSSSDATPLDTDVSIIQDENGTNIEKMKHLAAKSYGPIYIMLKRDGRFITTREEVEETKDLRRNINKLELFKTGYLGEDHYGIRTGFASSEIDYIFMNEYDPRVGLEIAMNGFYIPVCNTTGEVVFTPKMYQDLRNKMSGLKYYDMPIFNISENLVSNEILEEKEKMQEDIERTTNIENALSYDIANAIKNAGISNVHKGFLNSLTPGIAELYSTGSTSRNTNVPNDSDYDFLIKIDRELYLNEDKKEEFKKKLKEILGLRDGFGGKIVGVIQKVDEQGNIHDLDVEISICPRTDKVELSTDVSLAEKLKSVREQYPDKYEDVLANIVYAKELFKSINAYKSLKSDDTQGGLGGIGIENWILQHGGSLYDAAIDFIKVAEKSESFEEFKKNYQVFDLGFNHYIEKNGSYPHDNFVGDKNKMGEEGYERMLSTLKQYVYNVDNKLIENNNKTL